MTRVQSPGYFGQIIVENASDIGFTRQRLAECFMPKEEIENYYRIYPVLSFKGRIIPFDNAKLANDLLNAINPKLIESGEVKLVERKTFQWTKIAAKICDTLGLADIIILPLTKPLCEFIQIKTSGSYEEHLDKLAKFREALRTHNPKPNYAAICMMTGPCQIPSQSLVDRLKKSKR